MFNLPDFWQPIVVAWLLAQLSLWWALRAALYAARRIRPARWLKSKWRRLRAGRIPVRAHPTAGKDNDMRRFKIEKIRAYDRKGKRIAGTIEPVHTEYRLDSCEEQGKLYLFALARQGQALEQAYSLRLDVTPATDGGDIGNPADVPVKVLFADVFGAEQVTGGDYWNEMPERLRDDIQDRLADELMERARPEIRVSLFQNQRELYPYHGVAFAVTELGELDALFPPE